MGDLKAENAHLKERVKSLTGDLQTASNLLKRVQEGEGAHRKRKHSASGYSDRHQRRLKKQ